MHIDDFSIVLKQKLGVHINRYASAMSSRTEAAPSEEEMQLDLDQAIPKNWTQEVLGTKEKNMFSVMPLWVVYLRNAQKERAK